MANRPTRKMVAGREVFTKAFGKDAPAPLPPSWLSRDWLWGLLLVLAVVLAYTPVWWAGYVWDDLSILTDNPCIIGPLGLKEIWTTSAANICPLTITIFWVEHALWGLAPLPYHLVNVLLHGACAVLLWRVLRSLQAPGAWLGAALWALHPVQVESVAWITELKNTQSGVCFLLSILFFVRWLRAKNLDGQSGSGWNYALTLLFAALAMASKSSTVILPLVLCLCAWWVEGRWHWRNLARMVPVFLMSIAAGVSTTWTVNLEQVAATDPHWVRPWPERLVTAGDAVWFYLGKLLWPHPLITIYPRWQIDTRWWVSYLPLLGVIVVLSLLWLKRASWSRPWFFVFAYFLAALLPVLGLVDNPIFGYSLAFDHFQYLADMGPLALAGVGLARLADFVFPKKPWLQSSSCAALLLILGLLSWQRVWAYQSEETFWTDTLAKNPNCPIAHNNLGWALFQRRQLGEAMAQYQMALKIDPNYAQAHDNLGDAFWQKGQVDEAIVQFQQTLEINPNYAKADNDLGTAFVQKGQVDKAIALFQKALRINLNYVSAHDNLGKAFLQKGLLDEAIAQYQKALEINPNTAKADYALGGIFLQKGQVDEAIAQYQKGLEIYPNSAEAHNTLGKALILKGQIAEAIEQFQEALRLNPNNSEVQNNLAKAESMMWQAPKSK